MNGNWGDQDHGLSMTMLTLQRLMESHARRNF